MRLALGALAAILLSGCADSQDSRPVSLTAAQNAALVTTSTDYLNAAQSLLSDLIGCARTAGGPECVRPAFDAVEDGARSTRRTTADLAAAVDGNCAASLRGIAEPLDASMRTVREISDAARSSDYAEANRLADGTVNVVKQFGEAVTAARDACAA